MSNAAKVRLLLLVAVFLFLEAICRAGLVSRLTMIPPSEMVVGLVRILLSGSLMNDLPATFLAVLIAITSAIVVGFLVGVVLHGFPRARRTLDPFLATYYTVPTIIFYPLFIAIFGLNDTPKIIIGFLHAVVVMITSTINGMDRVAPVLRKTARIMRLSRLQTMYFVVLPSAVPYLFNGVKLAIGYGLVGVIGAEFILSTHGLGYRISYAFNSLDNVTMYSLLLLVMLIVFGINALLIGWERRLAARRGRRS